MQTDFFHRLKAATADLRVSHYAVLAALWIIISIPLYLWGYGWFSLLSLPIFAAIVVTGILAFTKLVGSPTVKTYRRKPNQRSIQVHIDALGQELPVHITMSNPTAGPQESSLQVIAALRTWTASERSQIRKMLLADALKYSDMLVKNKPQNPTSRPAHFTPAEESVDSIVKFDYISIAEILNYQNSFALLHCDPEWEPEHGRVIIIKNGQPLAVGDAQDELAPFDSGMPPARHISETDNKYLKIRQLLDHIPPDLLAYFEQLETAEWSKLRADLYTSHANKLFSASVIGEQALYWLEEYPLTKPLGGIILDDPNTSNHHFYLTRSPLHGQVFYLNHDGDSRVVFASLNAFLEAAKKLAQDRNLDWEDLHPPNTPLAPQQEQLYAYVAKVYAEDNTDLLVTLIPAMDVQDTHLTRNMARDEDFFIPEAIADQIARHPDHRLQALATLCAEHPHVQAARAGKRAVEAIVALNKKIDRNTTPKWQN